MHGASGAIDTLTAGRSALASTTEEAVTVCVPGVPQPAMAIAYSDHLISPDHGAAPSIRHARSLVCSAHTVSCHRNAMRSVTSSGAVHRCRAHRSLAVRSGESGKFG